MVRLRLRVGIKPSSGDKNGRLQESPAAKQALLTYNAEDCEALEAGGEQTCGFAPSAPRRRKLILRTGVVDTTKLKREHPYGFKRNTFAFPELDAINNAAYWDYQRERVYVKSNAEA